MWWCHEVWYDEQVMSFAAYKSSCINAIVQHTCQCHEREGPFWLTRIQWQSATSILCKKVIMWFRLDARYISVLQYVNDMPRIWSHRVLRHHDLVRVDYTESFTSCSVQVLYSKNVEYYYSIPAYTLQVIEEHRLVFQLNNNVIKSFPVSIGKGLAGVIKLIPVELLLILISIFIALFMMWYTRTWIQIDPDAEEFGDPDFVQSWNRSFQSLLKVCYVESSTILNDWYSIFSLGTSKSVLDLLYWFAIPRIHWHIDKCCHVLKFTCHVSISSAMCFSCWICWCLTRCYVQWVATHTLFGQFGSCVLEIGWESDLFCCR